MVPSALSYDSKAWPTKVPRRYMLIPNVCFNCESACGLLASLLLLSLAAAQAQDRTIEVYKAANRTAAELLPLAEAAMALSSITVVTNANRLRGARLGGMTAQYFLRFMGKDGFVFSRDGVAALIEKDGHGRNSLVREIRSHLRNVGNRSA